MASTRAKQVTTPKRTTTRARDPHSGPVPRSAWRADEEARKRGRVAIFNATRPGGLDGWTMDLQQYEAIRALILGLVESAPDGVLVKDIVAAAHDIYGGGHPLFPKGRLTNYCTFTKVDLEARCEIERVPGKSPQRIKRWDK
jgi:hypothetical protein